MIQATHKTGVSNSVSPRHLETVGRMPKMEREKLAFAELMQEDRCEQALKAGEKFELMPGVMK